MGVEGSRTNSRRKGGWHDDPPEVQAFSPNVPMRRPEKDVAREKWDEWLSKYMPLSVPPPQPATPGLLPVQLKEALQAGGFPKGNIYANKLQANYYWEQRGGTLLTISTQDRSDEAYVLITTEREKTRAYSIDGVSVCEVLPTYYMDKQESYGAYPHSQGIVSDQDWLGIYQNLYLRSIHSINRFVQEHRLPINEHIEGGGNLQGWTGLLHAGSHYVVYWDPKEIDYQEEGIKQETYADDVRGFLWFEDKETASEAYDALDEIRFTFILLHDIQDAVVTKAKVNKSRSSREGTNLKQTNKAENFKHNRIDTSSKSI